MSDLISRSELLRVLRHNAELHTDENGETRQLVAVDIHKLIEYVEKMPTAFDVEKVAAQIESESYWTRSTFGEDGYSNDDAEEVVDLVRVLGIMKEEVNK